MSGILRFRLMLDFASAGLMIACLAYWWLDNLSHELLGTALFALVIIHNVFNRRRYGKVTTRERDPVRLFNRITIILLALGMLLMLVTSLLISRDLFSFMALGGGFAVREIHMFAGYWVLLILAIHLGTRWGVVMNIVGGPFRLLGQHAAGRLSMVLVAMAIAAWGLKSSFEMAFGAKLILTYSLDMWDFNDAALGFFVNYASIVGLYAALTHYGLRGVRKVTSPRRNMGS